MATTERVLVLGLGVSGLAAAELAAQRGACVTVLDASTSADLRARAEQLTARGVDVRLEWRDARWPSRTDLCIISPGIPPESALGQIAATSGCPVISELEYGFRHCACPVLAITGTNGKTTTVELLTHCLSHAGYRVLAGGNIGRPLCELARKSAGLDFLVTEVSSFQLEHIESFAPLAAALLNVTQDHLNRYATFDDYFRTKLVMFRNLRAARRIVLREDLRDIQTVREALPQDGSQPLIFSSDWSPRADFYLAGDGTLLWRAPTATRALLHRAELKLQGRHNVENVLATLAVAQAADIAPERLVPHIRTFVPAAHRLELVAVHQGVQYINDSKATNTDAMVQALGATAERYPGRILLLAGGVDKGQAFAPLAPYIRQYVAEVFLIGKCRERLAKEWSSVVSCRQFASLAAAVNAAVDSAAPGDTVLLSPGCASQDMFADYAERGREFRAQVIRRIGE